MNEKKLMPESSYISGFQISQDPKALLTAYQREQQGQNDSLLLLLQHDYLGCDTDLGREQLQELLAAASNAEQLPQFIVLMDKAVLLACSGNEALGSLCRMEAMGTEIIACRRAAESYAADAELCCGELEDEANIWSLLLKAQRVIAL
ncbi:MAG: hypothetical protein IJP33_04790 [Firmicutes bacterium]|nr:hypothetical protein [Bacillota bacterium]